MKQLLQSPVGRLRVIGIAEGVSLLVLMGIAMPLKYLAGKPDAVRVVGWLHGLLFVAFVLAALMVYRQRKWPFGKLVLAVVAAFLPFGTFVFDRQLRKEEGQGV